MAERIRILNLCAQALTIKQRTLLYQRYVLDKSLKEIARAFAVDPPAVTRMHQRALRSLRTELAAKRLFDPRLI